MIWKSKHYAKITKCWGRMHLLRKGRDEGVVDDAEHNPIPKKKNYEENDEPR